MTTDLYPLLFDPITQPEPWAGNLLQDLVAPGEASSDGRTGIRWQLVDGPDLQSRVANGRFQGTLLRDLRQSAPNELVGRRHSANESFPLCVRILNVGQDQPLYVHPEAQTPDTADTPPNAKFWYTLAADQGAAVVAGIAPRVTGQQLFAKLDEPEVQDLLQRFPSRVGDSYLVLPGIVHSISAGNLMLEIAQRNVLPLRLKAGQDQQTLPESEREAALASIQLVTRQTPRISRETSNINHTRRIPLTPNCPHFIVDEIRLVDHISLRTTDDSFNVLVVVRGNAQIEGDTWGSQTLTAGQLCCVPASFGKYKLTAGSEPAEILRIKRPFIP